MENGGFINFTGILDPGAREFIPPSLFPTGPTQVFYPYSYPRHIEHPAIPYCEPPVAYPQYHAPPSLVRADPPQPPLPVALPPASHTPSRAILLSSVPTEVSESTVRRDLEVYGDVRAVEMDRVREGIVAVHFYDLRHAQTALAQIQEQHMQQQCRLRQHYDAVLTAHNSPYPPAPSIFPAPLPPPSCGLISGRAVWAQFIVPSINGYPEAYNQGSLVLFNVDCQVPNNYLKQIFEAFGCVKEVRETPMKQNQRFIEFYDTKDASKAYVGLNGKEINGKKLFIEFSRPGGCNKRFVKSGGGHNKQNFIVPNHPPRSPGVVAHHHTERSPPPFLSSIRSQFSGKNIQKNCQKTSNADQVATTLCLNIGTGNSRKNSKKNGASTAVAVTNVKQVNNNNKANSSKGWKGSFNNGKEYDPRFLIKEDSITLSNCSDPRTTVMIKNIPNKYSQKLLLNMLDNHCIHCNEQITDGDDQPLSSYDFVYLPIDFVNKCNVGYGFVNMTSPEATLRLYKSFHLQSWEVFNSRKICQVTYARLQGLEALKEHFKNSKFPCDAEYMPVMFSPPRDGRSLTMPVPIIVRGSSTDDNNINCNSSADKEDDIDQDYNYYDDENTNDEQRQDNNDDRDNDVIAGGPVDGPETALEAMRLFDENA